jgi:chromosome segregation ATPase
MDVHEAIEYLGNYAVHLESLNQDSKEAEAIRLVLEVSSGYQTSPIAQDKDTVAKQINHLVAERYHLQKDKKALKHEIDSLRHERNWEAERRRKVEELYDALKKERDVKEASLGELHSLRRQNKRMKRILAGDSILKKVLLEWNI